MHVYPALNRLTIPPITAGHESTPWAAYMCNQSAVASQAWPAANLAIYVPLLVQDDFKIEKFWVSNGTAVSGNFDVGIYDGISLAKLASTGTTAQAGTNTSQFVNATASIWLPRGIYLLALAFDNATGATYRQAINYQLSPLTGLRQEATAFTLPATATPVVWPSTTNYCPLFGLSKAGAVL